ncbi:AMP-binding protein [Roseibacterium sp. SDUM158016]|uniref:class I adenylate-forming enzyme family protein n=1 Tax=Roseicyclus sediminis TaxID=2980997 RepID=UPI0021D07084|nr:AMP-binding protein [Roseibacterium sp. SDUM158016]MCU4652085.1 AMP-binding protein [Roseibacterium sp. SDUM158016]
MAADHPSSGVVQAGRLSTAQLLARTAGTWPDNTALLIDGERLGYATLLHEAREMARGLLGMGLRPGDTLALLMPNTADLVRLFYAAGMVGACSLTLNTRFRGPELAFAIGHSEATILVVGQHALPDLDLRGRLLEALPELAGWDGAAPLAMEAAPALRRLVVLGSDAPDAWPGAADLEAAGATIAPSEVAARADTVAPDSPALMMYSSGTTARPKACLLSHASLNMIGAAFAERFRIGPQDRIYNPLPFFHMSTMLPMAACRASGAMQICTAHMNPAEALDTIEAERATMAYLSFPAIVSQITDHPDFTSRDLSSLRLFHAVGPPELMRRYAGCFPTATYVNAYGLTEATGVPVWTGPDDPLEVALTCSGRPFDGLEVRVADPETGALRGRSTSGELQLRGYCLFCGYNADPEATAAALTPDGWLRSGDLGQVDDEGRVVFEGRLKDMLKIGGENVAALEIETLLASHPAVKLAQVIGVPDARLGEVAAAYVEPVAGMDCDPQALVDWCSGRIAAFKVPRYIRCVTDWPMSTTKVQKFRLPRDFDAADRLTPRSG